MLGITPPYHSLQEMNLDWLLGKIKNMLRFLPDDGSVGQILRRTAHGAEWSDEQGGGGAVNSVNGQTGTVVLDASDVGALPDTTVIPDSTSDLVNDSGFITAAGAPVQSVNSQTGTVVLGKSDIGLGNVDNIQQYSASNPPPYPVTSVNGQTGAVTLSIPDSTSDLVNDSGFVDSAGAAAAAPVQSVNGQTGAVVLSLSGVTIVYDDELRTASYTHTVTEAGLYLCFIRANASTASTNPNASIATATQESQNNGATGGNTFCYLVQTLAVGDTITFNASNYTYSAGYTKYGRRTIIKLA